MTRTGAELHELVEAQVRELMTVAMRADPSGIGSVLEDLAVRGLLDGHTAIFLRRARRLTWAGVTALTAAIGAHRYGSRSGRPAWIRWASTQRTGLVRGPGCNGATRAALEFARLGYRVKEMIGGFEYWVREGFPVRTASGQVRSPVDVLTAPLSASHCGC